MVALIGIYAALVFDIFSSLCSSPQTTQLFASERASTLWPWVRMGAIVSVVFVGLGVWMQSRGENKRDAWGPLIGGMLALGLMFVLYSVALKKGGGSKPGSSNGYSEGYP
jgi:hypothetical protein